MESEDFFVHTLNENKNKKNTETKSLKKTFAKVDRDFLSSVFSPQYSGAKN